jgi:DNA-binding CsgD family transcriptional regulator
VTDDVRLAVPRFRKRSRTTTGRTAPSWTGTDPSTGAARSAHVRLDDRDATTGPDPALRALGLTDREIEVLGLVAEGRSNRQTSDALFISAKTASIHVSHILAKFGVGTRTEAASASRRTASVPSRSVGVRASVSAARASSREVDTRQQPPVVLRAIDAGLVKRHDRAGDHARRRSGP